jgi:hypothetical protein
MQQQSQQGHQQWLGEGRAISFDKNTCLAYGFDVTCCLAS